MGSQLSTINSQLLQQHFDTLAETPDAVAKLRYLVIELAARGVFGGAEAKRVLLGTEAQFVMGQAPPGTECNLNGDGTIFVKAGEFGALYPEICCWTTKPLRLSKKGDVLICVVGATVGKLNLAIDSAIGRSVAAIRPSERLDTRYLYYMLMPFTLRLRGASRGSAYGVIGKDDLNAVNILLPTVAEQRRIVAKVEELLALCDELEARQTTAREYRTRLVRSALDHLTTAKDESDFRKHSVFFVKEFPHFTATVDFIPLLRAGMIGMGVTGALTGGSLTWEEVQLRKVADSRLGKMLDKAKNKGKPLPYLRNTNVQWFRFELSDVKEMLFEDDELDEFSLRKGDLLICEGGEPGRCAVWDGRLPKMVFQKAIHRVRPNSKLLPEFLAYRLRADATSGRLEKHFTGATIKHFTGQELARYTFPLPPLAEQKRIVAKVDELLGWCDALEARLTAAQTAATHLLDATLHQILTA